MTDKELWEKSQQWDSSDDGRGKLKILESVEKLIALIRADEREACAVLAEKTICDTHIPTGINIYGTRAAKVIRARGNT